MSRDEVISETRRYFAKMFGSEAGATAYASGRVNLLGEHTDYNGGYVFPMPLSLGSAVAVGLNGDSGQIKLCSKMAESEIVERTYGAPDGTWTDYVVGPLRELLRSSDPYPGLEIAVSSDLPLGSGLSSSAALEVATIKAVNLLLNRSVSNVDVAKIARCAENTYVNVPCGIMDQYSVSVGAPGEAIFLDTRTLASQVVTLPKTHRFVIIHSGVTHKLADDGYRKRVSECNAACEALGVDVLSDLSIDDLGKVDALAPPLNHRARHVITENQRVRDAIDALEANNTARFADLMSQSHASQRDDYDVSLPEIDVLVDGSVALGADAARLTGGGFGGSIVALVAADKADAFKEAFSLRYPNAHILAIV